LMMLGREAMGASNVPVYVMPKMKNFLEQNGPWSQLVALENIDLQEINEREKIKITSEINVEALRVPHRDEFSETVGYKVSGPENKMLFVPDIDKWEKWERDILQEIKAVDYAFLDGTFFRDGEIPGRDMSEIPHPFIQESMRYFEVLSEQERRKIFFIHLNHTNPLLWSKEQIDQFSRSTFGLAKTGEVFQI